MAALPPPPPPPLFVPAAKLEEGNVEGAREWLRREFAWQVQAPVVVTDKFGDAVGPRSARRAKPPLLRAQGHAVRHA